MHILTAMRWPHLTSKNICIFIGGVGTVFLGFSAIFISVHVSAPWNWIVIIIAALTVTAFAAQMVLQSRDDRAQEELNERVRRVLTSNNDLPKVEDISETMSVRSLPQRSEVLTGEIYRMALSARTMSWELLRDVYRVQGRLEDAKIDCDALVQMYLVNTSKETHYVRDFVLSAQIGVSRVIFERQNDLHAIEFDGVNYEYGVEDKQSGEVKPVKPLFTELLPIPLQQGQPQQGWLRFMAKDINPEKLEENSWNLIVIDSLGNEYPITKSSPKKGDEGRVSIRRLNR